MVCLEFFSTPSISESGGGTICSGCSTDPMQSTDIFAGARHLGIYYNNSTTFTAQDWLGTVRARTDLSGSVQETCTSLAFADSLNCTVGDGMPGSVDMAHLTGQKHDWTDNLDHFQFRQYSNTQGRWMHPDPAGLAAVNPTNPQTWNRYGYVANNPLSNIDPSGLFLVCFWGICIDGGAGGGGGGGDGPDLGPIGVFYGGQYSGSWGMGDMTGWETQQFFGNQWYSLPGQQNPGAQESRVEGSYASWVNAVWRAGGSTLTFSNGGTVSLGWTAEGGVYGINDNKGQLVDVELAIAELGGAGTPGGGNGGDPTCSRVGGPKPVGFGGCTYSCESSSATDYVYVPMYKIQNACSPSWTTCPIQLQLIINPIGPFIFQGGITVVKNSCVGSG